MDGQRKARLGLPFSGIGVAKIGEDVGGSAGDPGHGLPLLSQSAWARLSRSAINRWLFQVAVLVYRHRRHGSQRYCDLIARVALCA